MIGSPFLAGRDRYERVMDGWVDNTHDAAFTHTVRITDPDGVVSRRHLRVALVGWNVEVVDLGSANGTFVALPGDQERHQLAPNQPFVVRPGTQVTMGRRWFRYESYRNP